MDAPLIADYEWDSITCTTVLSVVLVSNSDSRIVAMIIYELKSKSFRTIS